MIQLSVAAFGSRALEDVQTNPFYDELLAVGINPVEPPKSIVAGIFHDASGRPFSLDLYRGSIAVVNFWATWCAPCVEELPSLLALYERHADAGLQFIAINIQETPETVASFLVEHQLLDIPIGFDRDGAGSSNLGVRGLPVTFLFDRDGAVFARKLGILDWNSDELSNLVAHIIEEQ